MKTVVVSSYPPRHCGIGAYAHASVGRLRERGEEVVVVSPPDGDGDVKVNPFGGRPFLRAARVAGKDDRVIVHFQPSLYYRPRAPVSKVMTSLALLWLVLRRPRTRILVHEADPPRPSWRPDYVVLRLVFARAHLLFHTEAERRGLEAAYRVHAPAEVVPHTEGVEIHGRLSRGEARERIGVAGEEPVLLCPGFLHPDKGSERAVIAFAEAGSRGRLFIVGSVRDRTPRNLAYADELRALCARTPRVELVEDYVADADFDAWIVAADVVVLPYRRAFSSGALARARTLGTPAFVADVGGLAEQAGPDDATFATDEELVALMRDLGTRR